jgi:sterol desaturase/sphingolipid hydroxylase (fatty acid hydroxylase superfamily)
MRSRWPNAQSSPLIAVALVAAAAAAWWTADRWLPHAGPWTEQTWKKHHPDPAPTALPADPASPTRGPQAEKNHAPGHDCRRLGAPRPQRGL